MYQITDLFHTSWQALTQKQCYRIVFGARMYKGIYVPGRLPMDAEMQVASDYLLDVLRTAALPGKWRMIDTQTTEEQKIDLFHDLPLLKPENAFRQFPVKAIKSLRRNLHLVAPDESMANSTFGQFKFADNEFTRLAYFQQTGDAYKVNEQLNRLVATLYLPSGENFDKSMVSEYAEQVEQIAFTWQKALILEAYANTREFVIGRCPTFWPKSEHKEGEAAPAVPTGPIWHELHYDLAESEAFKGFDTVESANMYNVFDYLEKLAKRKPSANA